MFEGNDFSDIEDLKDVRAEQDYFKRLCFYHQINITKIISANLTEGKGLEHYELYAIQAAIRNFESDLIGLIDEKDRLDLKKINNDLEEIGIANKNNRKNYFEKLMEWKDKLVKILCKETEYLPMKRVGLFVNSDKVVNKGEHYYDINPYPNEEEVSKNIEDIESDNEEDLQQSESKE